MGILLNPPCLGLPAWRNHPSLPHYLHSKGQRYSEQCSQRGLSNTHISLDEVDWPPPACPAHMAAWAWALSLWGFYCHKQTLHSQGWKGQYYRRVLHLGPGLGPHWGGAELAQVRACTFGEGSNHEGVLRGTICKAVPARWAWAWGPWGLLRKRSKSKHVYTSKNWSQNTSQHQHNWK